MGNDRSKNRPAITTVENFRPVRAWASVAILLLLSVFSFLDRNIIALLVEPIKQDLGLSDTQLGLLQGLAFALLYSIAGLPIGWAVDRHPRKVILFLGMVIWSLSAAACGLARSFWQMFICRTFVGVGEATLGPVAVSLISESFPRDKVATPMGVYSAGFYLGGGAALAIGGWLVGYFNGLGPIDLPLVGRLEPWRATFIAAGLPGVFVALLAFTLFDPGSIRRREANNVAEPQPAFFDEMRGRWTAANIGFVAFGFASLVNYAIAAWTPAYMMRVHGWEAPDIGWTFGLVLGLSGATGALSGGVMLDRVYRAGHRDAYFLVAGTVTALALPFFLIAYFVDSVQVMLVLLCVGLALLGVVAASAYATWQMVAPTTVRGRMTAIFILVSALMGTGLGPVLVGLITDNVFADERQVGASIALVVFGTLISMSVLLFAGRPALRAIADQNEGPVDPSALRRSKGDDRNRCRLR